MSRVYGLGFSTSFGLRHLGFYFDTVFFVDPETAAESSSRSETGYDAAAYSVCTLGDCCFESGSSNPFSLAKAAGTTYGYWTESRGALGALGTPFGRAEIYVGAELWGPRDGCSFASGL